MYSSGKLLQISRQEGHCFGEGRIHAIVLVYIHCFGEGRIQAIKHIFFQKVSVSLMKLC